MGGRSCEFIQPGKNIHKCGFRKSLMRHLQMRSRLRDPEQGGSSVRPASVRWASGPLRPRRSASSPASRRSLAALSTPKGDPNSRHPPVPSDNAPWLEAKWRSSYICNQPLEDQIMRYRPMEREVADPLAARSPSRHRLRTRGGAASGSEPM